MSLKVQVGGEGETTFRDICNLFRRHYPVLSTVNNTLFTGTLKTVKARFFDSQGQNKTVKVRFLDNQGQIPRQSSGTTPSSRPSTTPSSQVRASTH